MINQISNLAVIVNNHRSGTTLLSCLFDGHQEAISLRGETRFFTQMDARSKMDIDQHFLYLTGRPYNWKTDKDPSQALGTYINRDKNWKSNHFWKDIQSTSADIVKDEENLKKVITTGDNRKIFLQMAELYKKYYWPHNYEPKYVLEKTPGNEFCLKQIFKMFPMAKVIHVVRDPFDIIESLLKSGLPEKRQGLMNYIYTWKMSLAQGIKYKKKYPNNYCFIKYENLVENTGAVMRKLSDFLGIEYNKDLLHPTVKHGQEPWNSQGQSHQDVKIKVGTVGKDLLKKDARIVLGEDYMKIIGRFVGPEYKLFKWNKYNEYVDDKIIRNVLFGDYPRKNIKNVIKNLIKSLISWRACQYRDFEYV